MVKRQVCGGIQVMKRGDNRKLPQSMNGFCPKEMNDIKTGRKGPETFDCLPDSKLRAGEGFYRGVVFCDLVSKVSYHPI
jgi:hypothetical protein